MVFNQKHQPRKREAPLLGADVPNETNDVVDVPDVCLFEHIRLVRRDLGANAAEEGGPLLGADLFDTTDDVYNQTHQARLKKHGF